MTQTKVLITVPPHEATYQTLQRDPALDVKLVPEPAGGHGIENENWPQEWLRDADVMFTSGVLPLNLTEAKNLRWIQLGSAGYENAINAKLNERSIRASNAGGVFDVAIAEWNICMIIALARDLRSMMHNQDQAVWDRDIRFQRELRGMTVGFWGYGGISRETARLVKAMGMNVHVLVRSGIRPRTQYRVAGTGDAEGKLPDRVFNMDQKKEFLSGLNFLIVAMPATPASIGAIGEAELETLPKHAYILNPARGPLIQEHALLKALREGWIAGAALDTHYHYPMPPEHPLWKFPNVIMTPHISGSAKTQNFVPRIWDIFSQNLKRYREGLPLINELSQAQLKGE